MSTENSREQTIVCGRPARISAAIFLHPAPPIRVAAAAGPSEGAAESVEVGFASCCRLFFVRVGEVTFEKELRSSSSYSQILLARSWHFRSFWSFGLWGPFVRVSVGAFGPNLLSKLELWKVSLRKHI